MNAAALRDYTTGVLRARAAYHERTKCSCGRFKVVRADGPATTYCLACRDKRRQPKTDRRRRAA